MSDQINLYGTKKNGKLETRNRLALDKWIDYLSEGEEVVIKIRKQKDYKTFRQVRLCYACLRSISDLTGHTVEEVKVLMKMKQGLCFSHVIEGTDVSVCKSISEMTKIELSDFIMKMDQWSTEIFNHPLLTSEDKSFLNDAKKVSPI